jgi:hypothetical protein
MSRLPSPQKLESFAHNVNLFCTESIDILSVVSHKTVRPMPQITQEPTMSNILAPHHSGVILMFGSLVAIVVKAVAARSSRARLLALGFGEFLCGFCVYSPEISSSEC